MNREIKFNAWIPEIKTMLIGVNVYNDGSIGIDIDRLPQEFYKLYHIDWDDNAIRENGTYNLVMNILTGDEYIWFERGFNLLQFTGLLDKNVKEIYEKAIVKNACDWISDDKGHMLDFKPPTKKYIGYNIGLVEWEQDTSSYIMGPYRCCLRTDCNLIEVIGNIYQNPDLLTDLPEKKTELFN